MTRRITFEMEFTLPSGATETDAKAFIVVGLREHAYFLEALQRKHPMLGFNFDTLQVRSHDKG